MTQEQRVLRHLKEFGKITSYEAFREYNITRLSAKIYNLRADGYKIITTYKTTKNRYGESVTFGVYTLENNKKFFKNADFYFEK